MSEYKSIDRYFRDFFREADVCVLSSHHDIEQISEMIQHLRRRCYNVGGVFWSNSYGHAVRDGAALLWDELLWIENPIVRDQEAIFEQLDRLAKEFSEFIIDRSRNN